MGEGIVREFGMDMDTLLYLTWRSIKSLLDSTGNSAQYSVITLWFPGGRDSQGVWDGHGLTPVFNTENQQGPAVQHIRLCSMSGGSLGLNPGLLHYRWVPYHLSHQGSPLEWVGSP